MKQLPNTLFQCIGSKRFVEITMTCISEYDLNHEIFVESFLRQNNTAYVKEESVIRAQFESECVIEFETSCNIK